VAFQFVKIRFSLQFLFPLCKQDFQVGVAFSCDGAWLASASELDNTVPVWDHKVGVWIAALQHPNSVYSVAFSNDRSRLATGCRDGIVRLWDTETWEPVIELDGHQSDVHSVAFSPDGTQLVSGLGDHTVRIWDTIPLRERVVDRKRNDLEPPLLSLSRIKCSYPLLFVR